MPINCSLPNQLDHPLDRPYPISLPSMPCQEWQNGAPYTPLSNTQFVAWHYRTLALLKLADTMTLIQSACWPYPVHALDHPLDQHCSNLLPLKPLPYLTQSPCDVPSHTPFRANNYKTQATIKPVDHISILKPYLQSDWVWCPHTSVSSTQSMHLIALVLSASGAIGKHDLKPP